MTTYLLIHGAGHDGWCWTSVGKLLVQEGHRVVAPDLPCEDADAGLDVYAEVAAAAVGADDAPLVVVGHSLGALTAALVATQLSAGRLVLVAGIVGQPGMSLRELVDIDASRDVPLLEGDIQTDDAHRFRFTEQGAKRALYHDCDPDVVDEACAHLRFQRSVWAERLAIDTWPDARIDSIVCSDDRIVRPEWSRQVAVERLGVEAIEMPGGHSPMLSRPLDLAAVLLSD